MTAPATLCAVERVTRRFGPFVAVDDVSLSVGPGEIVGLLGANGAGKTTLIRMILGLLAPSTGTVALLGGPPSRRTRARLGYVSQGLGLYTDLTVGENLAFSCGAYGVPQPALPAELAASRDVLVGDLGLGQQRRLAFLAALAHTPELLVLDEPTSGVDPLSRARLWDAVHERADAGVGVLVTTHIMPEAEQCDRLVLMSRGRTIAEGGEDAIVGRTRAVAVTTPDWATAFSALEAAGLPVTLAGTRVRVAGAEPDVVAAALGRAGVAGSVLPVRATLEEAMAALDAGQPSAG